MQHELKSWPKNFWPLAGYRKTCEIRNNDRKFCLGDTLIIKEYHPDSGYYTGFEMSAEVSHIDSPKNFELTPTLSTEKNEFVVLSLKNVHAHKTPKGRIPREKQANFNLYWDKE